MAITGLMSIVSELRVERTNLVSNSTKAHRRSSIGTGQAERGKFIHEAQADSVRSRSQEDQPGTESTMGEASVYERPSGRSSNPSEPCLYQLEERLRCFSGRGGRR
jgi:hypothetical protein